MENNTRMNDERCYSNRVRIQPWWTDWRGCCRWSVLNEVLQDTAGEHSRREGFGVNALDGTGRTWVLSRMCVEMKEMPRQHDDVVVTTWVERVCRMFSFRDFRIDASDGRTLGYARSVWAVIDLQTRAPYNLSDLYGQPFLDRVVPPQVIACPIQGVGTMRQGLMDEVMHHTVGYADLDINGHMHSVRYVEHMLDLFPATYHRDHPLQRLEIAYHDEALDGEVLTFLRTPNTPENHTWGVDVCRAGVTLCQARLVFGS